MFRLRVLSFVTLTLALLPLFHGKTEAAPRRLGSYLLQSASSMNGVMMVRRGRTLALADTSTEDSAEPGSVPLDNSTEGRIARYLVQDKCPSTTHKATIDRCQFLLRIQQAIRSKAEGKLRLSPRAQGIVNEVRGGRVVRRTVEDEYKRAFQDARRFIRVQSQLGGLVGRPRTLQQTTGAFQESVRLKRRLEKTPLPQPVEETEE